MLADGDRAVGDSTAITRWLDAAYPDAARIWPIDGDALDVLHVTTLVDVVLDSVVNLATRYHSLREHPSWVGVKEETLGRARLAADGLAARVSSLARTTIARSGWSAGDISLFTMIAWFEGLPSRAASGGAPAQVVSLGFSLPSALAAWADAHRERDDVLGLGSRER